MAPLTGIVLIKRFTYRDDPTEEWSNMYHFNGAPPVDSISWKAFADSLIAEEVKCYHATNSVVRAYGYADDAVKPISVWSHDYLAAGASVPGTLPIVGRPIAGDQAALLQWKLDKKNTRGKYVYLRKYFHGGEVDATDQDKISAQSKAAYLTFCTLLAGTGGNFHGGIRARAYNVPVLQAEASEWVTTRTLTRRGKRPLAHA